MLYVEKKTQVCDKDFFVEKAKGILLFLSKMRESDIDSYRIIHL